MSAAVERVRIDVRSERVGVSVRGALVLRTADGLPHQVKVDDASLVNPATEQAFPLAIGSLILEVQPGLDVIVPFEVKPNEIPRGRYQVRATVVVDGSPEPGAIDAEVRVR